MPKYEFQNWSAIGIVTFPPSESLLNNFSASSLLEAVIAKEIFCPF